MDPKKITWDTLLSIVDILVQKGVLTEEQLEKIVDLVDIKKIVKNNILTENFINKYIKPRIDLDDYDSIDLYSIECYQKNLKKT
jgi:hypothetical protein